MLVVPLLDQGGLERVCANTAQLLKNEYEVYLAVFNTKGMIYDVSGINLIDLKLGAVEGKIPKLLQVIKRAAKLSRLQKKLRADVCYSFGRTANLANALSHGKAKKIAACHSFGEIQNSREMKFVINRTDKVICCAKAMAKEVCDRYVPGRNDNKVAAVWNPCDIDGIRKMGQDNIPDEYLGFFDEKSRIIVSMGREDDVKGFWHLIKAFKRVNETIPDTKLVIIGEGKFDEYRGMAESMGICDRVLFTGVWKNPFQFLAKGSVYVLSSISEGLPNALVEALALELPIVSANCRSGPAEILNRDWEKAAGTDDIMYGDYGILSPALSKEKNIRCELSNGVIKLEKAEEKLAAALIEVLETPKLYRKYKDASLNRAREFSGENYKRKIIEIIEA